MKLFQLFLTVLSIGTIGGAARGSYSAYAGDVDPIFHPTCKLKLIGGNYLILEGPKRWDAGLENWGGLAEALTAKGYEVVLDQQGKGIQPKTIHDYPQDTLYAEVGFRKTYLPGDSALVEFLIRIQWVAESSALGSAKTWTLSRQTASDLKSNSKLLTLRSPQAEEKAMKLIPECIQSKRR